MMCGWPEKVFSRTTSPSFKAWTVTIRPMWERTSSNAGSTSGTALSFGCPMTRIIANCPERIVQVESSMLQPSSKRIRLTSATIPGRSLPTTPIVKCPMIACPLPPRRVLNDAYDSTPARREPGRDVPRRPAGRVLPGKRREEAGRREDADLAPLDADLPLLLELLQRPREGLGDRPEAGREDVLAEFELQDRPVRERHPPAFQLLGDEQDEAGLDVAKG